MKVEYLAHFPEHIDMISHWVFGEWGALRPELTLAQVVSDFQARAVTDRIPLALVAIDGDEVVGCLNLKESEDITKPGLSPWVGAVYVREDRRGQGVGKALMLAGDEAARRLGVTQLYLSATEAEGFYQSLGWCVLERLNCGGEQVVVMVKRLG